MVPLSSCFVVVTNKGERWGIIEVPFFFSFQVLDSEIIYARDYDYNYFGFKVCIIYYCISLSLI